MRTNVDIAPVGEPSAFWGVTPQGEPVLRVDANGRTLTIAFTVAEAKEVCARGIQIAHNVADAMAQRQAAAPLVSPDGTPIGGTGHA